MFDQVKKATYATVVYSIGNLSAKLTGFVLLPLYTTHLSLAEFGTFVLIEPIWQLLSAFLSFSIPTALLRWLAPNQDKHSQKSLVFTALASLIGILTLFNIIAYPLNSLFDSNGLYNDPQFATYLNWSFPLVSFDILNLLVLSLLRYNEKPWLYIALNTVKLSVNLGLNVYFIVWLKMGIESIIISQLISSVLLNILSLPFLLKNIVPVFQFSALKEMISYGFPLIFTTVSSIILSVGDRYIINEYFTRSETGLYGIGYKIGGIINMFIIQSFQLGFLPFAYKMLHDPNAKRFFSRTLTYYTFVLMFSALALSLFAKELLIIFTAGNSDFQGAFIVVPIITFSFVVRGIQYYFSLGLHYVKKTKYNAWVVMSCALISVGLNFLLVPRFGITGAAFSSVLAVSVMALLYFYFAQQYYPIAFEYRRLFILLVAGLSLFFIGWNSGFLGFWGALAVKTTAVVSYPMILYFFHFFNNDELNRLKQLKIFLLHLSQFFNKKVDN